MGACEVRVQERQAWHGILQPLKLRLSAIAITPFMPTVPQRLWDQLGLSGSPESQGANLEWGKLEAGVKINRGEPLFPRLDVQEVLERIEEQGSRHASY